MLTTHRREVSTKAHLAIPPVDVPLLTSYVVGKHPADKLDEACVHAICIRMSRTLELVVVAAVNTVHAAQSLDTPHKMVDFCLPELPALPC